MLIALFEKLGESGGALAVAAIGVFCWVLLRRSHRWRGPKDDSPLVRTPRPEDLLRRNTTPMPDDLSDWEIRLHETARRLAAEMDTKMSALQALIRDADRAAQRLEAAKAGVDPAVDPTRNADDYQEQIAQLAVYGFPPSEIASRLRLPGEDVVRVLGRRKNAS